MANLFEKYNNIHREYCDICGQISSLVTNWAKKNVGFVTVDTPYDGHKGLTRAGEVSWSIIDNNRISISYAVYEDKYGDYWSEDKYVEVELDELLKYN